MPPKSHDLSIAALGGAPLSPEQRKYNQLLVQINKARAELQAWQDHVPLYAQAHVQRARPLLVQMAQQRQQAVRLMAQRLADPGWTKAERRTLRRALCEAAGDLLNDEFIDEAGVDEMTALYNRHASTSVEAEQREALAEYKRMIEAVAGVDLGDEAFESTDALHLRAQEKLREAMVQQEREEAARPPPRRSARQSAAERKQEAQAQAASQSVREVFRKLASALHPDRAEDEADHARRTALMQRVNQAYAAQDLLALFTLQLEIEQVDPAHLARAGTERIRHYNRVLAAQLEEIKDEVENRLEAFGLEFGIEPWRRLNPRKLGPLLEEDVRALQGQLVRLGYEIKALQAQATAKRWVQEMRHQHRVDGEDPFGSPF
jgi:hypothetical protein